MSRSMLSRYRSVSWLGVVFRIALLGSSLFGCLEARGERTRAGASAGRTITTIREAHELPASDADKAYPVHFHGIVTYYDPYSDVRHAAMFLHDATGGIYVMVPNNARGRTASQGLALK